MRASALVELKRPEEAISAATRALELNPNLLQAHVSLGRALALTGRDEEAARELEKAASTDTDGMLHYGLFKVYKKLGRTTMRARSSSVARIKTSRRRIFGARFFIQTFREPATRIGVTDRDSFLCPQIHALARTAFAAASAWPSAPSSSEESDPSAIQRIPFQSIQPPPEDQQQCQFPPAHRDVPHSQARAQSSDSPRGDAVRPYSERPRPGRWDQSLSW